MNFINGACTLAQDYYQDIPQGTVKAMITHATPAFLYACFASADPKIAIQNGMFFGLAVAIRAFVTPLFNKLVAPRTTLSYGEELCRSTIPVAVLLSIINLSAHQVSKYPVLCVVALLAFNIYMFPQQRDLNHVGYFW